MKVFKSTWLGATAMSFLLLPLAITADPRLTVGPLPEPLSNAEDCINVGQYGWGWDGQQSCNITNLRFEGEPNPLAQTSADYGGSALEWNRVDVEGKTLRCDSYRRNFLSDDSAYSRARYDITFLTDDQIPADAPSEALSDVTGHFYLRGWHVTYGNLQTGLLTNFNTTGISTEQGYIFIDDRGSKNQNDEYIVRRFSHCYLRDETTPLRATGYCVDYDGDGIGWNGSESCSVVTPDPDCDYSNADKGSNYGWGYNPVTGQSCPPLANSTIFVPEDKCSRSDGGWGWNPARQESCRE